MIRTYRDALRAVLLALSVTLLFAGCSGKPEAAPPETTAAAGETWQPVEQRIHKGKTYRPREDLTVILILGLDKFSREGQTIGYTNDMQSDFVLLVVYDRKAETCSLLHLNRDTMTEIRRLGIGGSGAGTFTGQLALAHTYGSGGSDSALNAKRAVSTLLGGVEIHHYLTLTMDAVALINDALGGVTVTVMEDFGSWDPDLKQGQRVTLTGQQALLYVRGRKGVGDQSNVNRMDRQRQYLEAFFERLLEKTSQEGDFLERLLWKVSEDFTSDCTAGALEDLWEELSRAQLLPIRTLEGKAVKGTEFMEFYVDPESLEETVLSLFWEEAA